MKPSVIVTGAAGFIGSHLVRALAQQGCHVVATDLADRLPAPVLHGLDGTSCSYIAGDIRHDGTLNALEDAAGESLVIVHVAALLRFAEMAAALGQDGPSIPDALEVFDVNAMATWRLCSRFASTGELARFIYVSTRSVFGSVTVELTEIPETCPPSPVGIYGSSKTAAEFGVLALRDAFGVDLAIARVTGVYGPWQGPVSWIGKAVEGVLDGGSYREPTGQDDRYELTYVKDTVRGLSALALADRLEHAIYHVSSGEMHSLKDVAAAFELAAPDATVEFGAGSQPGMRTRLPLSGERMSGELGFRAQWTLNDAIADYLDVERSGDYGAEAASVVHAGVVD